MRDRDPHEYWRVLLLIFTPIGWIAAVVYRVSRLWRTRA